MNAACSAGVHWFMAEGGILLLGGHSQLLLDSQLGFAALGTISTHHEGLTAEFEY